MNTLSYNWEEGKIWKNKQMYDTWTTITFNDNCYTPKIIHKARIVSYLPQSAILSYLFGSYPP